MYASPYTDIYAITDTTTYKLIIRLQSYIAEDIDSTTRPQTI